MGFSSETILTWMAQYAYYPEVVYPAIFAMMMASAFGLPIPEEVTILSVGILAHMGSNPDLYPPPTPGAIGINGIEAAIFTSICVLFADIFIFSLGQRAGKRIVKSPRFEKFFSGGVMDRVRSFTHKYGSFAAFLFRFTPGIRFPGHLFLGMTHFSKAKFLLIDGIAVMVSVPTQILLVSHFGDSILNSIKQFKKYIFLGLVVLLLLFILKKVQQRWGAGKAKNA